MQWYTYRNSPATSSASKPVVLEMWKHPCTQRDEEGLWPSGIWGYLRAQVLRDFQWEPSHGIAHDAVWKMKTHVWTCLNFFPEKREDSRNNRLETVSPAFLCKKRSYLKYSSASLSYVYWFFVSETPSQPLGGDLEVQPMVCKMHKSSLLGTTQWSSGHQLASFGFQGYRHGDFLDLFGTITLPRHTSTS